MNASSLAKASGDSVDTAIFTRATSTRSAACIPNKSSWISCTSTRAKASNREGRCALERCRAERDVARLRGALRHLAALGRCFWCRAFRGTEPLPRKASPSSHRPKKRKSPPNGELSVRFNSSLLYAFAVKKFASSFANASSTSASSSSLLKARVWHSSSAPMSVWLM